MKSSAVKDDLLLGLDQRAALVALAVLLLDLLDLVADDLPAAVLVLEQAGDLPRALALVGELVLDDEDLEPRQAIQLQLEDRVGLLGVELEPLHDLLRRIRLAFRLADDPDDLVERVEDLLEPFEDVDALLQRLELVLEPLGHHLQAEVQEVPAASTGDRAARAGRPPRSRSESGTSG